MRREVSGLGCSICLHLDVFSTVWAFIRIVALMASISACIEWIRLSIALARVLLLGVQCSATSHCFMHAAVCFGLKLGGDGVDGEFHRLDIETAES
jgi:hypothetical protein